MDRGKEFYNDKLQQNIGGLGVGLHYIDAQSPWQNTRTEKAGGILKERFWQQLKQLLHLWRNFLW